jgi:hypothetical protein
MMQNSVDILPLYLNAIACTEKRLKKLISLISIEDPTAVIVIQADHGPNIGYNLDVVLADVDEKHIEMNTSIVNLLKLGDDCAVIPKNDIGSINSMLIAISCASGQQLPFVEEKSYIGVQDESSDHGFVRRVR